MTTATTSASTTELQDGQTARIATASELREWLSANRVHGLSAGRPDMRRIEATSLSDGAATSLEIPTGLLRALDAEMVWMHEVDTLPSGILLALRSQLDTAPSPFREMSQPSAGGCGCPKLDTASLT